MSYYPLEVLQQASQDTAPHQYYDANLGLTVEDQVYTANFMENGGGKSNQYLDTENGIASIDAPYILIGDYVITGYSVRYDSISFNGDILEVENNDISIVTINATTSPTFHIGSLNIQVTDPVFTVWVNSIGVTDIMFDLYLQKVV